MAKQEKFREKLFRKPAPKDLTWPQLVSYLKSVGFAVKADGTSHHSFFHPVSKVKGVVSKPHPGNELLNYQVKDVKEMLSKHERILEKQ